MTVARNVLRSAWQRSAREARRRAPLDDAAAVESPVARRIFTLSKNLHAKDRGAWKYWWLGDQVVVKTRNIADTSVAYTTSGVSTRYVDLLLPFIQRDSAGNLVGEGEWFYNGPGVDNVLGSWHPRRGAGNGTARRLFYKDYRGSVTYIATDNGRTMAMSTTNYSAYGAPSGGSGEAVTNPGFNGQEQAGGLVYMRNRWYDPNTGRFTQQDPIGYGGGINLYSYTGSDPVNYSDPFGLCPPADETPCGGFGGGGSSRSWGDEPDGEQEDAPGQAGQLVTIYVVPAGGGAGNTGTVDPLPLINLSKQREHVYGTPAYVNRVKQGKSTSAFPDL